MLKRILVAIWGHLQGWWRWWAVGLAVLGAFLLGVLRRTPPNPPLPDPSPLKPVEDDSAKRELILGELKDQAEKNLAEKKAAEEQEIRRSLKDTHTGEQDTQEVNDFLQGVSKTLPH